MKKMMSPTIEYELSFGCAASDLRRIALLWRLHFIQLESFGAITPKR
jgi:hypothetical protein